METKENKGNNWIVFKYLRIHSMHCYLKLCPAKYSTYFKASCSTYFSKIYPAKYSTYIKALIRLQFVFIIYTV